MSEKKAKLNNVAKLLLVVARGLLLIVIGTLFEIGTSTFICLVSQMKYAIIGKSIMAAAIIIFYIYVVWKKRDVENVENDLPCFLAVVFAIVSNLSDNFFSSVLNELIESQTQSVAISVVMMLACFAVGTGAFLLERKLDVLMDEPESEVAWIVDEPQDGEDFTAAYKARRKVEIFKWVKGIAVSVIIIGLALGIQVLFTFIYNVAL